MFCKFMVMEDRIMFWDGYQWRIRYHEPEDYIEVERIMKHLGADTLAPITPKYTGDQAPMYNELVRAYNSRLAPTTTCTNDLQVSCQEPKGNNPMYIDECVAYGQRKVSTAPAGLANVQVELKLDSAKSDGVADMRKHLLIRVNTLRYAKFSEIAEQFHRDEPASPKTIKDLKERLKKGLYTVDVPKGYDEEDEDEDFYWRDLFSWRTEDTKFDKDGYNAAYAELTEFLQSLEDKIKILDPKDTLSLLDDLKKWKPSKAKK